MYVALIFGLLQGKSTSDYEGLIKHVKNKIQPTYEPSTVYINFFFIITLRNKKRSVYLDFAM